MTIRPRRSVLYMPGSNARALEKARTLPADGVILDLEDAVAPDAKDTARRQVVAAVKAGGFGHREVIIRINGFDTPWISEDIDAAVSAKPDAILVPKLSSTEQLEMLGQRLLDLHADLHMRLWAMIETPVAVFNVLSLAAAAKDSETRLTCFVMGTNDLAKETRARLVPGRAPMVSWLASCVLAAHAHGVDVLDGVYNDLADIDGFVRECRQGRDMGFDGKTLIHPTQVEPCNEAFSPTAAEIDHSQRVIDAFEAGLAEGKGVITVDGRMIENLHVENARRALAIADAIAARGGS